VSNDPADDDWLLQERRRIGRRIYDAREYRGLTQEQVFLAVPVNRAYYQEIEAGRANPTLDMILRIARAIGVPASDLLRN
jgi:transcriptional regulator with XRE-family HTH domain